MDRIRTADDDGSPTVAEKGIVDTAGSSGGVGNTEGSGAEGGADMDVVTAERAGAAVVKAYGDRLLSRKTSVINASTAPSMIEAPILAPVDMPGTERSGAEGGADRGVVTAERAGAAGVVLPAPFTVVMTPEQLKQHLRARAVALGGGEPNQRNRGRGRGRGRPPLHEDSRKQGHTEGRGRGHRVKGRAEGRGRSHTEGRGADGRGHTEGRGQGHRAEGRGRGRAEGRGRGRTEGRGADGRGRTEGRGRGRSDDGRGRTCGRGRGLAEGRGRGRGADGRGRTEGRGRTGRTEGRGRTGGRRQGHTEEPPLDSCGRTSIEYKSYLLKQVPSTEVLLESLYTS